MAWYDEPIVSQEVQQEFDSMIKKREQEEQELKKQAIIKAKRMETIKWLFIDALILAVVIGIIVLASIYENVGLLIVFLIITVPILASLGFIIYRFTRNDKRVKWKSILITILIILLIVGVVCMYFYLADGGDITPSEFYEHRPSKY